MKFDHIALSVDDVAETIEFYKTRFVETQVLYQDETWGLITFAGIKLAFVSQGQHPAHIALNVKSREELETEAAKLKATITVHRDKSESFYFADPSGNQIELVYYPETD